MGRKCVVEDYIKSNYNIVSRLHGLPIVFTVKLLATIRIQTIILTFTPQSAIICAMVHTNSAAIRRFSQHVVLLHVK